MVNICYRDTIRVAIAKNLLVFIDNLAVLRIFQSDPLPASISFSASHPGERFVRNGLVGDESGRLGIELCHCRPQPRPVALAQDLGQQLRELSYLILIERAQRLFRCFD